MWKEVPRTRKKRVLSSHHVESSRPSLTTVSLEVHPSNHYCKRRVACYHGRVYMAGPNCLHVTTHNKIISILHTWHPCSTGLCTLFIKQHQVRYATQTHCSMSVIYKTTYVPEINYSLSHCNNMQSISFFVIFWHDMFLTKHSIHAVTL